MSRKALLITLSYFCVALVAAWPAVVNPPVHSWQRGSEGATFQEWLFANNHDTPAIDTVNSPYAADSLLVLGAETDHDRYESRPDGHGVWAPSGEIDGRLTTRFDSTGASHSETMLILMSTLCSDIRTKGRVT